MRTSPHKIWRTTTRLKRHLRKKSMSTNQVRLAALHIQNAELAGKRNDLKEAMACYEKAVNIYKAMAEDEPAMWEMVADTIERAGHMQKQAGEVEAAEATFKEAVSVREMLARKAASEDA